MPDFSQYLRPELTAYLHQNLLSGSSINLIGKEGQGSSRLLDDLYDTLREDGIPVLINMKTCRSSYSRFLYALAEPFGLETKVPSLPEMISRIKSGEEKVFLLLDHFDALLDNPRMDKRYGVAFFDYLNSLKNTPSVALLCATGKPHDNALVYVNGKAHSNSWLDLIKESLTSLSYAQVEQELARKLDGNRFWREYPGTYVNEIMGHEAPYLFMQHAITETLQLPDSATDIRRMFPKWHTAFRKAHKSRHSGKGIENLWMAWEKFLILTRLNRLGKSRKKE